MSENPTTLDPTIKLRGAIASAVAIVCSRGNADVKHVVDDILACIEHAGYRLVPAEPTEAMLIAARDWSAWKYGKPIGNDAATDCLKAMIAAADLRLTV